VSLAVVGRGRKLQRRCVWSVRAGVNIAARIEQQGQAARAKLFQAMHITSAKHAANS